MSNKTGSKYAAMFAKAFKQEQDKAAAARNRENNKDSFKDPRFIEFVGGNTYKFRLLYYPNTETGRSTPIITQYQHTYYDRENKKYYSSICTSSNYLDGHTKNCPICSLANRIWAIGNKAKQAGTPSLLAEKLYRQYKRKLSTYAVVYVVNDSYNPDNNGTCKIVRFGEMMTKFIDQYVFGKPVRDRNGKETQIDPDLVLGFDAFNIDNGRDLIITTTTKAFESTDGEQKNYCEYSAQFSPKYTSVDISEQELPAIFDDLNFDADFFRAVDKNAQQEYISVMTQQDILAKDLGNNVDIFEDETPAKKAVAADIFEEATGKDLNKPLPTTKEESRKKKVVVEDEDEEIVVKKPVKKTVKAPEPVEEDEDFDDIFGDEDETPAPTKKSAPAKKEADDDDDWSLDDWE